MLLTFGFFVVPYIPCKKAEEILLLEITTVWVGCDWGNEALPLPSVAAGRVFTILTGCKEKVCGVDPFICKKIILF